MNKKSMRKVIIWIAAILFVSSIVCFCCDMFCSGVILSIMGGVLVLPKNRDNNDHHGNYGNTTATTWWYMNNGS